jgi:large subunit ribosomal protein L9
MKVILRMDITNLGKQGDIKNVSPGHARNYLIPKNLVLEATAQNLKVWEKEKVKLEKERAKIIEAAKETAEKIEKISMTVNVKVGESGKLFGSVTNSDIHRILKENGFDIEKQNIIIRETIKETGVFPVEIRVHPEVIAKPKVWVVADKEVKTETETEAEEEKETKAEDKE